MRFLHVDIDLEVEKKSFQYTLQDIKLQFLLPIYYYLLLLYILE